MRDFSRQALARLALSDQACTVAESAAGLVGTRNDVDTGLGGHASQAQQLIEQAERCLVMAVVYDRERGSSWGEIGDYTGISADEAENRYASAIQERNSAFEEPYGPDASGRRRIPRLPTAAYDPAWASNHLDRWASLNRIGINDKHAVSGGLVMASGPDLPDPIGEGTDGTSTS